MYLRKYFHVVTFAALLATFFTLTAMAGSDLAVYSGPTNPGWITDAACRREADEMIAGLKGMFATITDHPDGEEEALGEWCVAHTGNGQIDVIILASGTTPGSLYPFPNKEPDGSNVEEFIDDGNVLINIADWIFYMSYEGGVRSPDNGADGAANVFNIPGLSFGSRSNAMEVNANGEKYLPSLVDFTTDRPWHVDQFDGTDWEVTAFAAAGDNDADPAVAVNVVTGGVIAAIMQKAWADPGEAADIGGDVDIEGVTNWMTDNLPDWSGAPVESAGKLSVTWGKVKHSF